MQLSTLEDLLVEELKDLYNAEIQLTKALPKMAKAATNPELKQAFQTHLEETRVHAERVEQIMKDMGRRPKARSARRWKGLSKKAKKPSQNSRIRRSSTPRSSPPPNESSITRSPGTAAFAATHSSWVTTRRASPSTNPRRRRRHRQGPDQARREYQCRSQSAGGRGFLERVGKTKAQKSPGLAAYPARSVHVSMFCEAVMSSDSKREWGLCVSCKWWQIEPDAEPQPLTAGYCIEEKLQPFQLRITRKWRLQSIHGGTAGER